MMQSASLVLLTILVASASAQLFAPETLAIEGYDPVAYFTIGKPVEGSAEHTYEWMGGTWRFSSQEHLRLFVADPERYAPAYGGWCAWAMANGKYAESDPRQWAIHEGRLYLNYSWFIQKRWQSNKERFIEEADEYWKSLP